MKGAEGMAAAAIQFHYTKWMKVEWNGEAGETEWFIQFNRSINSTRWNWIDGGLKWIEHEVNVRNGVKRVHSIKSPNHFTEGNEERLISLNEVNVNASIQPHSFQLIEWIVWLNWIDIITV